MPDQDTRWKQRLSNFIQAFNQLQDFIDHGELNKFEEQGLIQCFEYNYELSWNTIKDFYESQGEINIQGSRDAFRLAFNRGLIKNGELWMDMVKSRSLTSHTYNQITAVEMITMIKKNYYPAFKNLIEELKNHLS